MPAELTKLDTAGRESDYRPVSALAVAAMLCAGVFAVAVVSLLATALYTRKPVLVAEWLLVALVGFVLAIVARIQIRRSEGTRTGTRLASAAWWICLVAGLGYAAYYRGNLYAVSRQSHDFAERWFQFLGTGKLDAGYVLTLDPTRRAGINPDLPAALETQFGAAQIGDFRGREIVRLYRRYGGDVTAEPQSLRKWEQLPTGFRLEQTYRVTSPEGIAEALLLFNRKDSRDAPSEWQVLIPATDAVTYRSRTPFGKALTELEIESAEEAREWVGSLDSRRALALLLSRMVGLMAFEPLPSDFFRQRDGQPSDSAAKTMVSDLLRFGRFQPGYSRGGDWQLYTSWDSDGVRVRVPLDATPASGGQIRGMLVLRATNPAFTTAFLSLRDAGKANPKEEAPKAGSMLGGLPARAWVVEGFESDYERLPEPKRN